MKPSIKFTQCLARWAIAAVALAAQPAGAQGGPPGFAAVSVETVVVKYAPMESSVTAVGTIIADASAMLRAEVPGQILTVHFHEAQRVAKGDRLFSIESTVLESEVNEARANVNRSEAAYERAQELQQKGLISGTDYDAARANYDVDQARLRSSTARLSKTVIRAPFDGYVGLRRINVGDYATIGQQLVDVVQLDPLRVEFSVPETLLAKVQPGLPIDVRVDAYPDEVFSGEIVAISPSSDIQGHNLQVRANLPNKELKLRPGLFVRVNVTLGARENVILIPEQAIWPIGQDKTVFVVADGQAHMRVVRIGERQPGTVEIVSGLDVGEEIVTAGQMKLYDGAAVRSVPADPAASE
ncbi:MAG: efflux RND transporter periplasmic adaptor subunit [Gammaproteobacteria bacterium]|nr:efflux RND transporter periplasmic adaptor subunit [Gammaproteobacteria bacterium]MDH5304752.1 efflux RND transporter periplasmic adaptor subunit [Gammaproteobacteria bacterium]MDH5322765.1 efflux RND transporter periplasmic adaptor subunit [Gammaproteobacteria bacterium]